MPVWLRRSFCTAFIAAAALAAAAAPAQAQDDELCVEEKQAVEALQAQLNTLIFGGGVSDRDVATLKSKIDQAYRRYCECRRFLGLPTPQACFDLPFDIWHLPLPAPGMSTLTQSRVGTADCDMLEDRYQRALEELRRAMAGAKKNPETYNDKAIARYRANVWYDLDEWCACLRVKGVSPLPAACGSPPVKAPPIDEEEIRQTKPGDEKSGGKSTGGSGGGKSGSKPQRRAGRNAALDITPGLQVASLDTPSGKVHVYLPDDMRAGDRISGAVIAEPRGETTEARADNEGRLKGYVVEVETRERSTAQREDHLTFMIPSVTSETVAVILRDRDRKVVSRIEVPVEKVPADRPAPRIFETPDVVQTGKPVTVRGPFDGDVATTKVDVGGHPSTVLAESPRKLVAQAPHDVIGLSTIHISEQAIETAAPVRSVSVGLSAPKLMLRSGESTTVTAKVTGLEDLRSPLVLDFSNETPDVIRLEGGDAQHTVIMPGRVEPDGSYTFSRQVTATRAGSFEISVMLPVPQEGPQEPPDASRPTIAQSKDKNKAKGKWVLVEWIMTTRRGEKDREDFVRGRMEAWAQGTPPGAPKETRDVEAAQKFGAVYLIFACVDGTTGKILKTERVELSDKDAQPWWGDNPKNASERKKVMDRETNRMSRKPCP